MDLSKFGCNDDQGDGACYEAKESDGFHRCVKFVLRIVRWERMSVPCGRGGRVWRGWGVFSRTLRDIYSKCRCIDVCHELAFFTFFLPHFS